MSGISQYLSSCFAAGTPILTPEGSKSIEELRVGDWVLSLPEDDPEGMPSPRRVVSIFNNYTPLLNLTVNGQTIRTTAEHPFWVVGHGWRAAHQLSSGDYLLSHDKRPVIIEAIEAEQEAAPVYNVEVEEYHTYFVGTDDWQFAIWSHNVDCYRRRSRPSVMLGLQPMPDPSRRLSCRSGGQK